MKSIWRYFRVVADRSGSALFGDRVGLTMFLGAIVFFGLTWRIDFLLNDSYTIANTLVAVADGHLNLKDIVYMRGTIGTPGVVVVDGWLYGRNYGQVFLALPFLWLLTAVAAVAEPLIAVTAAWSLALLAFFDQVGTIVDRQDAFALVGAILAASAFAVSVTMGTPIDTQWLPLMALQLSTIVAAAFIPVVLYRLLDGMHDDVTGILAGAGVALVTPIGFWATVPKRHTLTTLLVVLAVYTFYRSRSASSEATETRFRMLSYVWGGLTAWIHAPEGVVLVASLGLVDIFTARTNRPAQLVLVGVVSTVALFPLLATNYLISGDPLAVPRMLPSFEGTATTIIPDSVSDFASEGSTREESTTGGNSDSSVGGVVWIAQRFAEQLASGLVAIVEPESFWRTFIRRGHPGYSHGKGQPLNLALLESMPLAALLAVASFCRLSRSDRFAGMSKFSAIRSLTPSRSTDLFVVVYISLLVFIYAPRLPVGKSVTVRYLHPLYPLVVYLALRSESIRRLLSEHWRVLAWSYAASVSIGGQLLVVALVLATSTPGEAVQLHGLVALSAAALLIIWSIFTRIHGGSERPGVVLVGLAGAVSTLFVILSANVYFQFMQNVAVPFMRFLSRALL